MEYYGAIKKNEDVLYVLIKNGLQNTELQKRKRQHDKHCEQIKFV